MWQRDWGVWGGGKTEEETREAKIKYYWGNILTVLMLHATVFRYSHFQSTAACPSNRDASTFWQKKKKKSLRFSPPDCARRGWAARWVHFPLPASICIYSADSPCSAESQLGLISKALYTRFQLRFLMADIYIYFFFHEVAAHGNVSHHGTTQ